MSGSHPELFIFHDFGDPHAGAMWTEAAERRWSGPVTVPVLPGHGSVPAPVGGAYESIEPAVTAARMFVTDPGSNDRVVVGVGRSGWSAQLLALAGRAGCLVLVDGLSGPFGGPAESTRQRRIRLRSQLAANLAGTDTPGGNGEPDSRVADHPVNHGNFESAQQMATGLAVPTLVVESPLSPTSPDHAQELAAALSASASELRVVANIDPAPLLDLVVAWHAELG